MKMEQELQKRNLPDLLTMNNGEAVTAENWEARKKELITCLCENLYGYMPTTPIEVKAQVVSSGGRMEFGGKAKAEVVKISFRTPKDWYDFDIQITIPRKVEKPPVILNMCFNPMFYPIMPVEEILDNGFALVTFDYNDIQPDAKRPDDYYANFTKGLGGRYIGYREREKTEWGKVGMWAYGASRVMDYLQTRDDINTQRIAICGHSRLGKTALWCKALDPRFYIAMGNDTNYGGGGLIRGHIGEDVPDFMELGSYDFFCERFKDFLDVPHEELPFDQHFLMACHAPGLVYLCGATNDSGMDPVSEFLSCYAASAVYKLFGKQGLVCNDEVPAPGEALIDGEIGFHIRQGTHYCSREDWLHFMAFFKKHL